MGLKAIFFETGAMATPTKLRNSTVLSQWVLVMSPSRAGSSHSSSWRIFSSPQLGSWPFSLELGIGKWLKNELKFQLSVEDIFSIIKMTKLCIWIRSFTFKKPKVHINDYKIDWNHELIIKTWGKNELKNFGSARIQLEN